MTQLNFPEFQFRISEHGQKKVIFDEVRKKFIPLTPEEWVRQHALHLLAEQMNIPYSRMSVERELLVNGMKKRFDLVVFSQSAQPLCLAEFKAPHIQLSREVLLQTGIYNLNLNCRFFWISNGIQHIWLRKEAKGLEIVDFPQSLE